MVKCRCFFSDQAFEHIENLQELFQRNSLFITSSESVEFLLRYLIPGERKLPPKAFFLIDAYVISNPAFLKLFYDDLLMSAIFHSESEPKLDA